MWVLREVLEACNGLKAQPGPVQASRLTRVSMLPSLAISGWIASWNISNVNGVPSWLPCGDGQVRFAPGVSTSTSMAEDGALDLVAMVVLITSMVSLPESRSGR